MSEPLADVTNPIKVRALTRSRTNVLWFFILADGDFVWMTQQTNGSAVYFVLKTSHYLRPASNRLPVRRRRQRRSRATSA